MGMAASQVRFLSLQNRKNTVGLNLMTLSNRKLALSRDMNRIANEYNDAMNMKTLKWSGDSGITYSDLTYDTLMKPNNLNATLPYIVTDAQGRVVLDDMDIELDGKSTGVSYRDLAMMISAYSGRDGETTYNNTANLSGGTNITAADIKNAEVGHETGENKASSGKANELGYEIVSTASQTGSNTLRYDLMEKLGLISDAEVEAITDLETELYGPKGDPNAAKFPVDSLMGKYYLAEANLEAYKNFVKAGNFKFSTGMNAPNSLTEDTKNSTTDKNSPTYKPDKSLPTINGSGVIDYVNNYNSSGTNISFNGDSTFLSKVDLEGVNSTETIYNTDNSTFKYTINNGNIQYNYLSNTILSTMGTTGWTQSEGYPGDSAAGVSIEDKTWEDIIKNGYAIYLHHDENDVDCEDDDYQKRLEDFINEMGKAITTNAAKVITIDTAAMQKAQTSTYHFFKGDITNNDIHKRVHSNDRLSKEEIREKAVTDSKNWNLVTEWQKNWDWFSKARHATVVDAKNVFNTLITFYNYYCNVPDAAAIVDDSGGSFEAGTSGGVTENAPSFTTGIEFDDAKTTTITVGDKKYIRKEASVTGDDGVTTTIYQYFNTNDGVNPVGNPIQEDLKSSDSSDVYRIYKDADGNINKYKIGTSSYNNNTVGITSAWTKVSNSGASATSDKGVLVLSYKDEFGNDVTYKLANSVSESCYATTITGAPTQEEIDKNLEELTQNRDEAKAAVDEAEAEKAKYFDSTENKMMDYFDALFKMIAENGWVYDPSVNSGDTTANKNYLNAKLQNNMYFITEVDTLDGTDFNYATKIATNVSKVFEVYDKDAQNAALSKYEAEKADINAKEQQVDIRMNKLEAEQDAISTELDSIKKIIDDNVSVTFKIFT